MKKLISVILAFFLVVSFPTFAHADNEKTDRRGCFEFTELFISRLDELAYNTDTDFDLYIHRSISPYASNDGSILFFDTSAGTLWLDSGDLSVVGIDMTLRDDSASEDENTINIAKCMVAISAFECTQNEDKRIRISSKVLGGPSNAFDVAKTILDQIVDAINSEILKEAIKTGEDVYVCSGNYDYYIGYIPAEKTDGESYGYINLHAESRQ